MTHWSYPDDCHWSYPDGDIPWKVLEDPMGPILEYFMRNISVGPTNIFVGPTKILGFRQFFSEKFWLRYSLRIDVTKKVGS